MVVYTIVPVFSSKMIVSLRFLAKASAGPNSENVLRKAPVLLGYVTR